MMRTLLMACLFAAATPACWGGQLLIDSVPTFNLPGFRTYVFSIETDAGEDFRGVDATFTGPMNQVNPLGMSTPFAGSFSSFWVDGRPDSHFLFNSGDVFSIGVDESGELLTGAIAGLQRLNLSGPRVPFAQIATATPDRLHYDLQFDLGTGEAVVFRGFLIPEPTAALLMALPLTTLLFRRRPVH